MSAHSAADSRRRPGKTSGDAVESAQISKHRHALANLLVGWLFLLPGLAFYLVFVFWPIMQTAWYSFYDWNGIDASRWVGLSNFVRVFTDPVLIGSIGHSFYLVIFFSLVPVALGIIIASLIRDIRNKAVSTIAQVCLFLPRVIPGAAAAVAWTWMLAQDGIVNQMLQAMGLGSHATSWLGNQHTALTSVGVIGFWLQLGFCIVLLSAGIGSVDKSLYEAASIDGAGWWSQLWHITLPGLRGQIAVCLTMTVVAALASFDVVFMATQGGPGYSTMVPGVMVYRLAFTQNRVGLASALALVLMVLVLVVVGPLQRLVQGKEDR